MKGRCLQTRCMVFAIYKRHINYVSKLFQPQNIIPKGSAVKHSDISCKSQKLMLDLGMMKQASSGAFHLLPLAERALSKLIKLVDEEMESIGAQKLLLPFLTRGELWRKTGRWEEAGDELFTLQDRHSKEYVLSPTHEEAVTELVASISKLSYRLLPLRLYQISSKFRDEMRPRFGLLRGKEFVMKDLYSFDTTQETAIESYQAVTAAYDKIFRRLGVPYKRVVAATGMMGGSLSHEFVFPTAVGEAQILTCESCGHAVNVETCSADKCPQCESASVTCSTAIEVGHTFLLGTKYSEPLDARYMSSSGKPELLHMGSYGLGMTRILGAAVECLSLQDEIRWPRTLAPYLVCIVPPKKGSKEEPVSHLAELLYHKLEALPELRSNVIIDDRIDNTIGKRVLDAKRTGYPYIVVVGRKATGEVPEFEVLDLLQGQETCLPENSVVEYFTSK